MTIARSIAVLWLVALPSFLVPGKKNVLALFDSVPKECRYVANVWCYHFLVFHKSIEKLVSVDRRLMIKVFKKNVLCFKNSLYLYLESLFVKQLLYLKTYLCIFTDLPESR